MTKRLLPGPAADGTVPAAMPIAAEWRDEMPEFRVGLLGGENAADRARDNACL